MGFINEWTDLQSIFTKNAFNLMHKIMMGSRNTWFQILFWAAIWILVPTLFGNNNLRPLPFLFRSLPILIGVSLIVWINLEILIPKVYFKRGFLLYTLSGLALLLVVMLFSDMFFRQVLIPLFTDRDGGLGRQIRPGAAMFGMRRYFMMIPFLTSLVGSAFYEISLWISKRENELTRIKKEKLDSELKFLRSQMNPHFLFNALNNIYALSVLGSSKTPEYIQRLSEMLRYVMHDSVKHKVSIQEEIDYVQHYINLFQLKEEGKMNIEFDLGDFDKSRVITPLLFIPLVENAFKHGGLEDLEKGWAKISVDMVGDILSFRVENSLAEKNEKDATGGIGLENIKRQLALLYPGKHEFKNEGFNDRFEASLKLDLS